MTNNQKIIIGLSIIALGVLFIYYAFIADTKVGATYNPCRYNQCVTPIATQYPSTTPSIEPSVSPEPTVTEIPTATPEPTLAPDDDKDLEDLNQCTHRDCNTHPKTETPAGPPSTGFGPTIIPCKLGVCINK